MDLQCDGMLFANLKPAHSKMRSKVKEPVKKSFKARQLKANDCNCKDRV